MSCRYHPIVAIGALCALIVPALIPTHARADDYKVYQPRVENGEFAVEANLNYDFDHRDDKDHYFSQVLGVEYGINDYWRTELSGEVEKEYGINNRLTHLKWENILVPWKHGENWMDVGFYAELEKARDSNEPNNFEAKLLLEKEYDKFDNTVNLIAGHEFGPHHSDDTESGFALQTRYRLDRMFEPGLEYYAGLGPIDDMGAWKNQEHQFGPVAEGKIGKVRYDAGLLFGISDAAPDTTAKLNLEYEF